MSGMPQGMEIFYEKGTAVLGNHVMTIVLDSSFNPPTKAHVSMLETAIRDYPHSPVLLSISRTNADKRIIDEKMLQKRKLWMRLVLDHLHHQYPQTCLQTVCFEDARLFWEKLVILQTTFPSPIRYLFLMGDDTVERFFDRDYYADRDKQLQQFFIDARIRVFPRKYLHSNVMDIIPSSFQEFITVVPDNLFVDVASTTVRYLLESDPVRVKDLVIPSIYSNLVSERKAIKE